MTALNLRDVTRNTAPLVAIFLASVLRAGVAHAAGDAQQVKHNFAAFFDPHTPAAQRVRLLQDGQRFEGVLRSQERQPVAQETSAAATDVQVRGDHAAITYTISLNGQPALANQRGEMVKENGRWKVSDQTFCDIETMRGFPPPGCPSPAQ